MDSSGEEDFAGTPDVLPVLDPPPGFEDGSPVLTGVEDHYYDDPYSEEDELETKSILNFQAVSRFANQLAQSLVAAAIVKPRVKMRAKKVPALASLQKTKKESSAQAPNVQCLQPVCDLYSVPIDNLASSGTLGSQMEHRIHHTRHSIAVPRTNTNNEPVHMTLDEVRSYLREFQDTTSSRRPWMLVPSKSVESTSSPSDSKRKSCFVWTPHMVSKNSSFDDARTKRSRKSLSVTAAGIKQALFSVFRLSSHHHLPHLHHHEESRNQVCPTGWTFSMPGKTDTLQYTVGSSPHQRRALPPLPQEPVGFVRVPSSRPAPIPTASPPTDVHDIQHLDLAGSPSAFETSPSNCFSEGSLDLVAKRSNLDFAASIEAVKDHGWYWGPLAGEVAEQILSGEPDGSFLVRDSSDDHYIFSLSFKLNGGVRHVRIEHDHGNFSFGSVARFRSQTMVEFIDKAIEHSRSGRFLFFLHRRPTHGPTRVQLLHPVSRFRQVQSLQHLSRFVILKFVRRDQINLLPLPKRLRDYLNTAHYYSEQLHGTTHHSP